MNKEKLDRIRSRARIIYGSDGSESASKLASDIVELLDYIEILTNKIRECEQDIKDLISHGYCQPKVH